MKYLYMAFGWCLKLFYNFTGSYGWAIVLFSIFSQIILLPISLKQAKSMEIQKAIAPEIQKIQAKYPHDKDRQNEEMSKIYQANNYNPLSGCLPLLLQFPIIIGLFGALRAPETYVFSAAEYAGLAQNFLWIRDMSVTPIQLIKDLGFFAADSLLSLALPVLCVVLTFVQSKMSTAASDKSQQTTMLMMTAMIGYFSLTISQGIAIYWTLRTLLGIVQQYFIGKKPVDITVPKKEKKKNSDKNLY